ncbi:MAG: hypothetical protein WBO45_20760, partial [Planctomycetota bacterium]
MVAPERAVALAFAALLTACASAPYAPCPVACDQPLPADAFARCRRTLERTYGGLAASDEVGFRLQTVWTPVADPPGERRATVFRADDAPADLAVVVELRWLTVPWFGLPGWTGPRA